MLHPCLSKGAIGDMKKVEKEDDDGNEVREDETEEKRVSEEEQLEEEEQDYEKKGGYEEDESVEEVKTSNIKSLRKRTI